MSRRRITTAIAGAVLCGLTVPAMAGTTAPSAQDLQAQIASLKAQVAQMQQNQDQNWLNEQRKAEVKSLIKDVLSDASTRSTLLQDGQMAGISEDGKIFLRSADGSFEFSPSGLLQIRYIYNNRDEAASVNDKNVSGFQLRRARFIGDGHIGSPKIGYHFELSADNTNDAFFEEYYLDYHFDNGLTARAGRFKQPFARAQLIDEPQQLAVERSIVTDYFGVGRADGAELAYETDQFLVRGALNNGANAIDTDFNGTTTDFSLAARVDYKVTGDWSQLDDSFNSWSGTGQAIFVGGALAWENARHGNASYSDGNTLRYTVDASLQQNGLSLYAAGYGRRSEPGTVHYDDFGLVLQAGYFVVPDQVQPFVRYAGMFLDKDLPLAGSNNINLISAGINWYQHRQNAKFTLDGVYAFNPIPSGVFTNTAGAGLLPDTGSDGGQLAIRAQYQLMF